MASFLDKIFETLQVAFDTARHDAERVGDFLGYAVRLVV
jgi:hypothetical protein